MAKPDITQTVMDVAVETWPQHTPLQIAGHVFTELKVVTVTLERDGVTGRGEASGVFYKGEDTDTIVADIAAVADAIGRSGGRGQLQHLLPPSGARNAVDAALWDLDAQLSETPVWMAAGLAGPPRPVVTTFTCGADAPERMAEQATGYAGAKAIKLKLTGESIDNDRVAAVRGARQDVWLGVDANQALDPASFGRLMPALKAAQVSLIEQPFPVREDHWLDEVERSIPIAADESVQRFSDIAAAEDRYDVVNIKLDKCGGLTEALAMVREVRARGMEAMVGNMMGTSLGMAPGWIVGQLCSVVDLDGPLFLASDRPNAALYADGMFSCPLRLWGFPRA